MKMDAWGREVLPAAAVQSDVGFMQGAIIREPHYVAPSLVQNFLCLKAKLP